MDFIMDLINKILDALKSILSKLGLWETVSNLVGGFGA